jgi:tRNA U34 2-thiouridine synthase MnmA/TrmU
MSGGVDSSVAALLLKEQGHEVIGVHMTNWDAAEEASDDTQQQCIEQDYKDAKRVCEQLGIGFHEVSFVREYWSEVFEPLLEGYHAGGTPNPDVMCNRHIKFDRFVNHALSLGADRVATGHYARVEPAGSEPLAAADPAAAAAAAAAAPTTRDSSSSSSTSSSAAAAAAAAQCDAPTAVRLLRAADAVKDQTYFLAHVRQEGLRRALFPLGPLLKAQVRERAAAAGLHTATKRESMGICFIGKRRFSSFLEGYLPQEPGPFVCVESGRAVGLHRGYALYTPGQRARMP